VLHVPLQVFVVEFCCKNCSDRVGGCRQLAAQCQARASSSDSELGWRGNNAGECECETSMVIGSGIDSRSWGVCSNNLQVLFLPGGPFI
jgi:hypothetical protein